MKLTNEQYEKLLQPLAANRVASRKQAGINLSYLEAWDVKAHLIRIFGFGGWSADVISAELVFEDKDEKGRWNVGYKVVMRLTIHAYGPTYTEAAVGSSTQSSRGDAHDMAIKTAESDALKRAAINLGTQFGLSLYDNGNKRDVVGYTMIAPDGYEQSVPVEEVVVVKPMPSDLVDHALAANDRESLKAIWDLCVADGWLDLPIDGAEVTMRNVIVDRLAEIDSATNEEGA
jgi:hypothetical protein